VPKPRTNGSSKPYKATRGSTGFSDGEQNEINRDLTASQVSFLSKSKIGLFRKRSNLEIGRFSLIKYGII